MDIVEIFAIRRYNTGTSVAPPSPKEARKLRIISWLLHQAPLGLACWGFAVSGFTVSRNFFSKKFQAQLDFSRLAAHGSPRPELQAALKQTAIDEIFYTWTSRSAFIAACSFILLGLAAMAYSVVLVYAWSILLGISGALFGKGYRECAIKRRELGMNAERASLDDGMKRATYWAASSLVLGGFALADKLSGYVGHWW